MKFLFIILFAILNFATSFLLNFNTKFPEINIDKQEMAYNFKSKYLSFVSFGNKNMLASILWIATMIESDTDHYKKKDNNSWMFHRFDTITDLNKNFYEAYRVGGIYLSIIKDDDIGAKIIYEKGLSLFPDDIELNYNYGFHCQFELLDYPCAVKHYEVVLKDPISKERYRIFLPSIVARLKNGLGDKEGALKILYDVRERFKHNEVFRNRFDSMIKKVKEGQEQNK